MKTAFTAADCKTFSPSLMAIMHKRFFAFDDLSFFIRKILFVYIFIAMGEKGRLDGVAECVRTLLLSQLIWLAELCSHFYGKIFYVFALFGFHLRAFTRLRMKDKRSDCEPPRYDFLNL